jgi:hypothetical protein
MASIMLVAFALRALIPPGFMPASGHPFSLEFCWEGLPTEMLANSEPPGADAMDMPSMDMAGMPTDSPRHFIQRKPAADAATHGSPVQRAHGHHGGSPTHGEHCVFGTACSPGPTPCLPLAGDISPAQRLRAAPFISSPGAVCLVHIPQPRAPPRRLS